MKGHVGEGGRAGAGRGGGRSSSAGESINGSSLSCKRLEDCSGVAGYLLEDHLAQ